MVKGLSAGAASFARFYRRVLAAHFLSYVGIGAVSYMLIMRYYLPLVPADTGLRQITSSHVQFWIWPAQFVRALVLAAALYPFRGALVRMGARGGLAVAGLMVGIGCLGGFNGLIENLIFYQNVSLYLYYIHIPEIGAQTLCFGYLLVWLERRQDDRGPEPLALSGYSNASQTTPGA